MAKDDPLCEIETDKITMELNAEVDGVLKVEVPEGTTVRIGAVIGMIDEQKASYGNAGAFRISSAAQEAAPHISPTERKAAREKAGTGDRGPGTGKAGKQVQDQVQAQRKSRHRYFRRVFVQKSR